MPLTGTGSSPGRNSARWNARRWDAAVSRLISSRRSSLVRSGMRETTMEDRRWKMEVAGPFDLPSSIFHRGKDLKKNRGNCRKAVGYSRINPWGNYCVGVRGFDDTFTEHRPHFLGCTSIALLGRETLAYAHGDKNAAM